MALKSKSAWILFILELFFIIIFGVFVKYGSDLDASDPKHYKPASDGDENTSVIIQHYPMFQDINVMIFLGIGYLYSFLRKYSYSGIGMNFILCAISVQWGIITNGWWNMKDGKMEVDLISLTKGEFSAASAAIAMGALFGKVGFPQLIAFTLIEVLSYSTINYCCKVYLQIADVGESVALHMFAAIYGCSTAFVLDKKVKVADNPNEASSYNSNVFAILGTILLWIFWPSFNAAGDTGDSQYRSVMNTFLGLIGSGITCFAMSALLHRDSKFNMSHIQNGALAGAVGIGSTSNLMMQPFGALLIGALSGCICVTGFKYFSVLLSRFRIHDPCGIHSLHGLPGLFAGFMGILAAFLANKETYGFSLYKFYPAMAPVSNSTELLNMQINAPTIINPGLGRSVQTQALYQFIYIVIIMILACLSGLLTGSILRMKILEPLEEKCMYLDDLMWDVPDVEIEEIKGSNTINQNFNEKQV